VCVVSNLLLDWIKLENWESNKDREEEEGGGSSLESEGPVPEAKTETPISDGNGISFDNQSEIFRAIEVVERDSLAIFSLRFPPFGPLRIHLHLTPSHAVLHRCHRSPSGIWYLSSLSNSNLTKIIIIKIDILWWLFYPKVKFYTIFQ